MNCGFSINFFSLLGLAILCGCQAKSPENYATPVRPQLDQFVLGGELTFNRSFDTIIREDRIPRREVRRPLLKLHEILKGSDFSRDRTATVLPLGIGLSNRRCERDAELCPGENHFAEAIRQAGIDAMSLAALDVSTAEGQTISRDTRTLLSRANVCTTGGGATSESCFLSLGSTSVAVVAISLANEDQQDRRLAEARKLSSAARERADIVVLMVAHDKEAPAEERRMLLRQIAEASSADVVLGHFDGPFDAVEKRNKTVIVHNAGSLLSRDKPQREMRHALLYRFHVGPSGLSWMEGIPVRLKKARSRQAYLGEANAALGEVMSLSSGMAEGLSVEFGRLILEMDHQGAHAD